MKIKNFITKLIIIIIILTGVLFSATCVYSDKQLQILKKQPKFDSSQEAMLELILNNYSQIHDIEIVHSTKATFSDLYFVEAHVWAEKRSDKKAFKDKDYDNPGNYFLRIKDGWVHIPEGKYPKIIVLGRNILNFSKDNFSYFTKVL